MTEPIRVLSTRSAASGPEAGGTPGPLVSVAWLTAHLGDPDLRLVHTSSLPEHYPAGHIPGAVNVPVTAMHVPGTQRLRRTEPGKSGKLRLEGFLAQGREVVQQVMAELAPAEFREKFVFLLRQLGACSAVLAQGVP